MDYSAILDAVDFTSAVLAIVNVLAAIAGAVVGWKGGQWVLDAIGGGSREEGPCADYSDWSKHAVWQEKDYPDSSRDD